MPRILLESVQVTRRTSYPPPHDKPVAGRSYLRIAEHTGLSQFGANICTLEPGAWSSQRHWHSAEDELVVVLAGEVVLVEEGEETIMRPGDIAVFKAGDAIGHHFQNRSEALATFLAIGTDMPEIDVCTYPDIGMVLDRHGFRFTAPPPSGDM